MIQIGMNHIFWVVLFKVEPEIPSFFDIDTLTGSAWDDSDSTSSFIPQHRRCLTGPVVKASAWEVESWGSNPAGWLATS